MTPANCATEDAESSLQMLAFSRTIFSAPLVTDCVALAPGFVLKNVSANEITIESVHVAPDSFVVVSDERLPRTLQESESIRVPIGYQGTDVGKVTEGSLAVVTSAGCMSFEINGLTAPDTLITQSEYVGITGS
jgi:hypothetical protein